MMEKLPCMVPQCKCNRLFGLEPEGKCISSGYYLCALHVRDFNEWNAQGPISSTLALVKMWVFLAFTRWATIDNEAHDAILHERQEDSIDWFQRVLR